MYKDTVASYLLPDTFFQIIPAQKDTAASCRLPDFQNGPLAPWRLVFWRRSIGKRERGE